jgi:hypothetical protein
MSQRARRGFLPRQATSGLPRARVSLDRPPGGARPNWRVLSAACPSVLGELTRHLIERKKRWWWRISPPGGRALAAATREPARERYPEEGGNWSASGRGPAPTTAPAGPERPCRKRRGPSAGDDLGNRGAIRARFPCTEREHGGTQAVSHRPGSPREAWSEGPRVLLPQHQPPRGILRRRRMTSRAGEPEDDRTRWPESGAGGGTISAERSAGLRH